MAKAGTVRIGISGWTYKPWRGVFYPEHLRQKDELKFASRAFRSIEINGTFYGTQRPPSFTKWAASTPDDFMFSVKAPRFITHIQRLRDVERSVANFFAGGVLVLGPKLGPILWQFPATMKFDATLFETFFALLPHDTTQAVALAKQHDARLNGRDYLETDAHRPVRHAVEIRSETFRSAAFIKLLRRYKIALVCADTVAWPRLMDVTAEFMYCRLHGAEQRYASGYDGAALDGWARRIDAWRNGREPDDAERVSGPAKPRKSGRDVFVYFDNDLKIRAPCDAAALAERLGASYRAV